MPPKAVPLSHHRVIEIFSGQYRIPSFSITRLDFKLADGAKLNAAFEG